MRVEHEAGMSSSPSANLPFIVSSSVDKVDAKTRKLIRSHVMRGKGRKRTFPDKSQWTTNLRKISGATEGKRAEMHLFTEMYASQIPSRVGSDLSFIEGADETHLSILANLVRCSLPQRIP